MISHRCRYKARGSVLIRVLTASIVRWIAARVTLSISTIFSFQSSPPLFYHSTRISISDAPREFFLYLSNWILRQVTIVVLTQPGVWHKRQSTPSEGDLSGGRCTLEIRAGDRIQRNCRVVLPKLLCLLPAKGRERHITLTLS